MSEYSPESQLKLPPSYMSAILNSDFQPFALFNRELRFTYTNRRFTNLLGHPPTADLTGFHLSVLPITERPEFQDFIYEWIEGNANEQEFFYSERTVGRAERVLAVRFRRLDHERLRDMGIVTLRDATQEQQLLDLLRERVKSLTEQNNKLQNYIDTNLQLENFAYLASHDLKEPLRVISNFAGLLERQIGSQIDEDAKESLGYIRDGVQVMNDNINDLLIFTNLDRQSSELTWVNCATSVFILERFLETEINASSANIQVGNLPERIYADRGRFRLLLQHLVGNALKFRKTDCSATVRISCEESDREWIFSVSDNGLGIEPEYHEKIFLLFKRLHNRTEYSGSGVGLSICQKIIEQHGGRIWLESEPGEGTTVSFTIPKPVIMLG